MNRGTHKGSGSDIFKRFPVNFDEGSWSIVEAYKKMRPGSSYSDCVRSLIAVAAGVVNKEQIVDDPDNFAASAKSAEKLIEDNKIGMRFKFPEGYSPAAMVKVCPVCGSDEDFFEDTLQWNCNVCLWAGTVADYPVGGITWITVTHKMRRKYARQEAVS